MWGLLRRRRLGASLAVFVVAVLAQLLTGVPA
jgi:hypothetical protein